jgi:hypothetical protein
MLVEPKSEPTSAADPWRLYLYSMRSPATKEKYIMRLGKFLSFLNLQGTLEYHFTGLHLFNIIKVNVTAKNMKMLSS